MDQSIVHSKPLDYAFPQIAYGGLVVVVVGAILGQFVPEAKKKRNRKTNDRRVEQEKKRKAGEEFDRRLTRGRRL